MASLFLFVLEYFKLTIVAIDSVEDTGNTWVRSAGFDEAWKDFEDRPRL